jgi:hypothetical protein
MVWLSDVIHPFTQPREDVRHGHTGKLGNDQQRVRQGVTSTWHRLLLVCGGGSPVGNIPNQVNHSTREDRRGEMLWNGPNRTSSCPSPPEG